MHVSGGGDAVAGDNDFTATVPVKVLVVPIARILPTTPTSGLAPLTVSLDASLSTCTPTCDYQWDFGDGSTAVGLSVTHIYRTSGVYTATLKATNEELSSTKSVTITAADLPPVVANAGDDRTVPPNTTITLDGRSSTPGTGVGVTYDWNFGDGSPHGAGALPSHAWTTNGDKTVTLTVTRGSESSSDTAVVHVETNVGNGLVTTVTSGSSPLSAADVVVIDGAGTRYPGTTNASGVATLKGIPDGSYTVLAYHAGFQPQRATATVTDGNGTVSIALVSGSVAATTVESRRLSLRRDHRRGHRPERPCQSERPRVPDLSRVRHCGLQLEPADHRHRELGRHDLRRWHQRRRRRPDRRWCRWWTDGPAAGWRAPLQVCAFTMPGGQSVSGSFTNVGGQPQGVFVILSGKARWLKEFYEVKMVVANLAPEGITFVNGHATLDLPDGLTIAPSSDPKPVTQSMADIDGGHDGSATWLLRGDKEGSYPITVHYSGSLDPFGASLDLSASAVKPLRVWGLSAISVTAAGDPAATAHAPYHLRVRITNVTNSAPDPDDRIPIYNPAISARESGRRHHVHLPARRAVRAGHRAARRRRELRRQLRVGPELHLAA